MESQGCAGSHDEQEEGHLAVEGEQGGQDELSGVSGDGCAVGGHAAPVVVLVLHAGQSCGAEGNQHGEEEGTPHQRALAPHYLPGDALIAEDLCVAQVSEHAVGGVESGQGQSEGGQDPGPSGFGALDGQGQQDPLAQPTRPGDGWARLGELGHTGGCSGVDCCGHGGLLFVLVGCRFLVSRGFLTRDLSIKGGLGQGGGG